LSLAFFFSCHAPPRALPSFPTRRSSDLGLGLRLRLGLPRDDALRRRLRRRGGRLLAPAHQLAERDVLAVVRLPALQDFLHLLRRSEEHTSELQSRSDLVCRLLLEKKKLD